MSQGIEVRHTHYITTPLYHYFTTYLKLLNCNHFYSIDWRKIKAQFVASLDFLKTGHPLNDSWQKMVAV
jgi:hypothetical protein